MSAVAERRKPKLHEYGVWQRPPRISKLHTNPTIRPHTDTGWWAPPREGQGDYRGPYVAFPGEEASHPGWAPVRNGLPEPVSYQWRPEGWERFAVKAGLDLAAIAAADAELERRPQREREPARTSKLLPAAPVLTPASKVRVCARLHCDNKFVPANPQQKYCSHGCRAWGR